VGGFSLHFGGLFLYRVHHTFLGCEHLFETYHPLQHHCAPWRAAADCHLLCRLLGHRRICRIFRGLQLATHARRLGCTGLHQQACCFHKVLITSASLKQMLISVDYTSKLAVFLQY
ncbi:hypothetical protein DUNSADRAFT_4617, partial [Dunaliella salina]